MHHYQYPLPPNNKTHLYCVFSLRGNNAFYLFAFLNLHWYHINPSWVPHFERFLSTEWHLLHNIELVFPLFAFER